MIVSLFLLTLAEPNTHRYAASALYAAREIYLMGGSDEHSHKPVPQVDVFNPGSGKWRVGQELTAPRDFAAITSTGSNVLFVGGVDQNGHSMYNVDFYNYTSQTWSKGPPLRGAVSRAAAAMWGLECIVTGGIETSEGRTINSSLVQMYNRRMGNWTLGPDLPEGRHGHTCTVVGDTVYVIGGELGSSLTPTPSVISLKAGEIKWKRRASLPHARAFQATVAFGGHLYVFGHRGRSAHPIKYDPKTDKWKELACADIEAHRTAYAEAEGKVYFFGGEGERVRDRVFDLAGEKWVK